jgi:hypothetical protein
MLSVTLSSAFPDGTALVTDNASGSMLYVSPAPEHKKSTVFMGGGTRWQLRLYQAGTFTFTDKSGQDRVVPRCATSWQWAESLLDAGQNVDTTADDNTKIELRRTWREQQERLSQLRAEEKERQARMDLLHRQTLAAERAAQAAQEEALARERIAGTLEQQRQDADIRARREQADRAEQNKALKRQADSLDEINWGMRQSRPVQIQEPSR